MSRPGAVKTTLALATRERRLLQNGAAETRPETSGATPNA